MALKLRTKDPLYLVLDTNVFLASSNHNGVFAQLRRSMGEILDDFCNGYFGTLPSTLHVRIPWIVRSELVGIASGDVSRCWHPQLTTPGQAKKVLEYLDSVALHNNTCVSYQNKFEYQEVNTLKKNDGDNDEMVLLTCVQVRQNHSTNVWLVTNDVRLQARAMRSGIGSVSLSGLMHAITLQPDATGGPGNTFVETIPPQWLHVHSSRPLSGLELSEIPKLASTTVSTNEWSKVATTNSTNSVRRFFQTLSRTGSWLLMNILVEISAKFLYA